MASLPLTSPSPQPASYSGPALTLVPVERRDPAPKSVAEQPRLSALEWSIVALAERDNLASLREPGRLAKAVELLFGISRPNKLANSRSETLRRVAVWTWRRGWNVPQSEIDGFLAAGFSLDQLDLIQTSIARSRDTSKQRRKSW